MSEFDYEIKEEPKRKPFSLWEVNGQEFKLKLRAGEIAKLEAQFNDNLLMALSKYDMPPLIMMLKIIHGGMQTFHHSITLNKVMDLYDDYVEEGKDQTTLLSEVIMPLLTVSGFFTQKQATNVQAEMEDLLEQ